MLGSWVRAPYRSQSGNSIDKRNERTSFEVLFLVLPENRVIGFVLLPISPAELGKTTNTTFTTSNNLRAVARIALLLQGKQQNTTLRQDITPGEISRKCVQGEALFIVVSLAATLGQHRPRRGDVSPRSVVTCCKSCSSCFPCVHVESLHFLEEPEIS